MGNSTDLFLFTNIMTDKQLEKLGLFPEKQKGRYWSNVTQDCIYITKTSTPEDILEIIYKSGLQTGIIEGKQLRSKELRNLLDDGC